MLQYLYKLLQIPRHITIRWYVNLDGQWQSRYVQTMLIALTEEQLDMDVVENSLEDECYAADLEFAAMNMIH